MVKENKIPILKLNISNLNETSGNGNIYLKFKRVIFGPIVWIKGIFIF